MVTTTHRNGTKEPESSRLPRLASIIEHFVHPSLRREQDTLYRARVLIVLLLFFAAISASLCFVLPLTALPLLNQILGIGLCFLVCIGTCALLLHLQRYGNYRLCSKAIGLLIGTSVLMGVGLSGGIMQSSITQILMLPPLLAYFLGDLREGNQASLFWLLVVLGLLLIEYAGFHFPQLISSERDRTVVQLLTCIVNLLMISAIGFAYELTATKLKNERDREHQKALALARMDVLTGLANRRTLDSHLTQRIETCSAMKPSPSFAFCCIDLDRFKPINDQYGHKIGDEVLCVIAERLRLLFRGTDIVARHGGDEFMAMFDATDAAPNAGTSNIEAFAERILDLIGRPIETSVGPLQVGASLGFALYPRNGLSAEALKRAADSAMYEAKSAGGTAWRISQTTPGTHTEEDRATPPSTAQSSNETSAQVVAPLRAGYDRRAILTTLVDIFLHPSLRAEPGIVSRGRVLALAMLMSAAIVILVAITILLEPLPLLIKTRCVAICIPSFAIIASLLVLLRNRGSYAVCSMGMVLWVYSAAVTGILLSGGVGASCVTQLLVLAPLLACLFGGTRSGIGMAIMSFATIMLLGLFEVSGFHFYMPLDPATAKITQPTVSVLGILFCCGSAFIYESVARTLKDERDREHQVVGRLAHTDALTGLVNRLKFDEELGARINRFRSGHSDVRFALCYVDLDGFKPVNDRFGHAVGDEVLKAIAERLQSCTRDSDVACRQGGDEFMMLFASVKNEAQMEFVARRLSAAITPAITTRAGMINVKASLGFALFPTDGDNEDTLKNAADKAMYAAKKLGSGWKAYQSVFHGATPSFRVPQTTHYPSASPLKA
jgi:diguanylate cyclase (GGDEF)-like protein